MIPTSLHSSFLPRLLASCLLLAACGMALAQQASAASGADIAAKGNGQGAAACASCHGARGEGVAAFPRLAGTGDAYLLAQLDAFASGARANPVMQPIAQALSPQQRAAVARYYSGLPPPLRASDAAQAKPADTGAWLATRGRWSDEVPACAQCHGPGGNGVGPHFPPLAGLPAGYIAQQLHAWRDGKRPPGPLDLMQRIASKLSGAEVEAVSAYYAGLAAAPPATAAASGAKRQP